MFKAGTKKYPIGIGSMSNCPVCESDSNSVIYSDLYDDRYGYIGKYQLLSCENCRHMFLDGDFNAIDTDELYTRYYPRASIQLDNRKLPETRLGFSGWLEGARSSAFRWVPPEVTILDIGCGLGDSLRYHVSRGCDAYGVEADTNVSKLAKKYQLNIKIGEFDSQDYEENFFDFVTMDQVIEHLDDPIATLDKIKSILKPNGMAIITTPNPYGAGRYIFGRRWINWHVPYHRQFFSRNSFRLAAKKAGLTVEKIRTITSSDWMRYQWIHLMFIQDMGVSSPFWAPDKNYSTRTPWFRVLNLAQSLKINHLLTKISDGIGAGDNYVIFLRKN